MSVRVRLCVREFYLYVRVWAGCGRHDVCKSVYVHERVGELIVDGCVSVDYLCL